MKTALKIVVALALLVVLIAAGGFTWAKGKSASLLARTIDTHVADFPIPFSLDSAEVVELGLTPEEAEAVAVERAVKRGKHLVRARYGCSDCHGSDFGGGVMVDDAALGTLLGPNITSGSGSRTADYGATDWDRIVRHGVKPDGTPSAMPAQDFQRMSDQELSDIVAYIRSVPPVDATVPPVTLGPLGTVLVATGQLPLAADLIRTHDTEHVAMPPEARPNAEFGEHLAGVCMGCHQENLGGGLVPGGDPSWPPASNLTPHADGLADWTHEDFVTALREGRRPDGTELREPMTLVAPFAREMTDVELRALWEYLRSVPAVSTEG